jgi:hypothetical protein
MISPILSQIYVKQKFEINVRESSSLSAKKIISLRTGSIVTYKGFAGYWTEIVNENGVRGFVSSQFLFFSDDKID